MKILFCAGFAPIVSDLDASVAFYERTLTIPGFHRDADCARRCFTPPPRCSWP